MAIAHTASADNENDRYAASIRIGDSCMRVYQVTRALTYYRKALADHPTAALRMKIANGYYLQHNYAKCVSMMEGIALDSLDHDTMCHLFRACKELGLRKAGGRVRRGRHRPLAYGRRDGGRAGS